MAAFSNYIAPPRMHQFRTPQKGVEPKLHNRRKGLVLLAFGLLASGAAKAATVISVGDGDTLSVLDRGQRLTIRLACIDAPETVQAPYGAISRRRLQVLAPIGSVVKLHVKDKDRYGRTVAEILRNGENINIMMVRTGLAFVYRQYLAKCDAPAYLKAEQAAEASRLGVWALPSGITRPWDFRRGRRTGSTSPRKSAGEPKPSGVKASQETSGVRYRCKEIGSFTKAQELLRQGHSYLDRDGNGIACESLR